MSLRSVNYASSPLLASKTPPWRSRFIVAGVALAVDGHRGEITLCRAAVALAALEGREAATATDVKRVASLTLRHRLRKDPLESSGDDARIRRALQELPA